MKGYTFEENELNFIATGDNVLLEILIPEKSKGGIMLPQVANPKEHFKRMEEIKPLRIVSMGIRAETMLKEDDIKVGSYVYLPQGVDVQLMKLKGLSFVLVSAHEIVGRASVSPESDEDKAQLKLDLKQTN